MKRLAERLSLVFASGCVGALVNSVVLWLLGSRGITGRLGVNIAPDLTPDYLYPRLVWGGIWGALFILPMLKKSFLVRGLIFSLAPTLVQLFVIFPLKMDKGMMGLALGNLTPLVVFVVNAVWGVVAAFWLLLAEPKAPQPKSAQHK